MFLVNLTRHTKIKILKFSHLDDCTLLLNTVRLDEHLDLTIRENPITRDVQYFKVNSLKRLIEGLPSFDFKLTGIKIIRLPECLIALEWSDDLKEQGYEFTVNFDVSGLKIKKQKFLRSLAAK